MNGVDVTEEGTMTAPKPPKWLVADTTALAAAYRHGVTSAIWARQRRVLPSYRAYVIADAGLLRFATRVCVEWMHRHPVSPILETGADRE